MPISRSKRAWAWIGLAALVMTAGVMARRSFVGARAGPDELRDAVASPALPAGALRTFSAFSVRPARRMEKPVLSSRLTRFADALDAQAARLRRPAR